MTGSPGAAAPIADASMRKARRALASADILLGQGDTEGACNRAYYAMFHAAHVALRAVGAIGDGALHKTHSGLIGTFGRELVLKGVLPSQLGRALSQIHDMRLLGDYSGEPPGEDATRWAVDQAARFVTEIVARFGEGTRG